MNDILGREIKVGDRIAVPGRSGSSLYVMVGVVTEIVADRINYTVEVDRSWRKMVGRKTYTTLPAQVAIL